MKKNLSILLVLVIFLGCGNENSKEKIELVEFDYFETTNPNDTMRFLKKDMSPFTGILTYKFLKYSSRSETSKTIKVGRIGFDNETGFEYGTYKNGKRDGYNTIYHFKEWEEIYKLFYKTIGEYYYTEPYKEWSFKKLNIYSLYERKSQHYVDDEGNFIEKIKTFVPRMIKSGNYTNGVKNGLFDYYRDNGRISKQISWKNGVKHGVENVYYENKNILEVYPYRVYKSLWKNGTFDLSNNNYRLSLTKLEKLEYTVNYKNSLKNGEYKYYYKNGQLKVSGHFTDDDSSKVWKSYFNDGKLESIIIYENRKIISKNCYDKNGNKITCEKNKLVDDVGKSNKKNNRNITNDKKKVVKKKEENINVFSVIKNPKSLTNFSFKIPNGFREYDKGKKNTTIMIFKEKSEGGFLNTMIFKVNDFPKYKKLSSMSQSEINQMTLSRIRDKSIDPNQFSETYNKNNRLWLITGTFSVEKNIYTISSSLFSNKQVIMFVYLKDLKPNVKESIKDDIKMFKDLIDSFEEH